MIEKDDCISCGTCINLCEDVFTFGDENLATIVEKYRGETPYKGKVPEDVECVKVAVENCPISCINIKE